MKNNKLIHHTIILLLVSISFVFRADIIPENSHSVERTVVITNCNDFPDIQLIGCVSGVMPPNNPIYAIEENQQITSGYKFNSLYIFGIKRITLESIGGIDNITEEYMYANTTKVYKILTSGIYYINNSSSLSKDELYYEIVESLEGTFKVELKKRVLTFDDDTKTINY